MQTMPHWAGRVLVLSVCCLYQVPGMHDAGMDPLVDCACLAAAILEALTRLHPALIIWR
jgi:hypothetical protein